MAWRLNTHVKALLQEIAEIKELEANASGDI
jgi:hypothetical protein